MTPRNGFAATVAICTANRSSLLGETLAAALSAAAAPSSLASSGAEVLVVDNGSTDGTPELLAEVALRADRAGLPFRAVREPRPGLSAARNRAVREARGEIVLFLDDDALPGPGWLDAYLDLFRDRSIDAAGGPVEPIWSGALPAWLKGPFLLYVSAWDRGPACVDLTYNEYPRGANMAFRAEAFTRCGDFLEQLGRKGASLRSCEEIELCLRLERAGRRIVYVPEAGVRHHVATDRLTPNWMARRFAAQGFSEAILEWRHAGLDGLARGLRRTERVAQDAARTAESAGNPYAQCQAAARRGYRQGALYAIVATPRYAAPDGTALAPFATFG